MRVVEKDEGSASLQILPALSTFLYLLTFKEGEILYLSTSLAVAEEEFDKWGEGCEGRVRPRLFTIVSLTIRRVFWRLVGRVLQYRE